MTHKQLEEMKSLNIINGFDYQVIKNLLQHRDMINKQIKVKCTEYDRIYKEIKNDSKQTNEES